MPRQDGVYDLRHHGVVVANDTRKNHCVIALAQAGDEVVAKFVFHAAVAQALFEKT